MKNQRYEPEIGENSAARSVNKRSQPKCDLIDWCGSGCTVAEGRIISADPADLVNGSRLGPMDVKVLVETCNIPDAFLWRPADKMSTIKEVVGKMIAWPSTKCINLEQGFQPEDIAPLGRCKLLDLSTDDVIVAEGRWQTQEPNALVNGLPLGPKAVKVFIDVVHIPETFIWRPTMDVTYLDDCVKTFVAWPAVKVVFEDTTYAIHSESPVETNSPTHTIPTAFIPTPTAAGSSKSPTTAVPVVSTPSAAGTSKSYGQKDTTRALTSPVKKLAAQSTIRRSLRKHGVGVIKVNQNCKLMDIGGKNQVVFISDSY